MTRSAPPRARGRPPTCRPLADAVRRLADLGEVRAITVDTRVHAEAGATVADEIAFALATGVAYLRHLEAEGVDVAEAFRHIEFRVSASADQFLPRLPCVRCVVPGPASARASASTRRRVARSRTP